MRMAFNIDLINQAAEKIKRQIETGEISEACCMASIATPVTEAWEIAQELAEQSQLSQEQQHTILSFLNPDIQKLLISSSYDDFDLIYERLLQLISLPVKRQTS
jgi:hypothetical protein